MPTMRGANEPEHRPNRPWRLWLLAAGLAAAIASCDEADGDDGSDGTDEMCVYKEAGTNFAPCEDDSDCLAGHCDLGGNPGPYCFAPTRADVAAGSGWSCTTNAECEEAGADLIARGGYAACHIDDVYSSCDFGCPQ